MSSRRRQRDPKRVRRPADRTTTPETLPGQGSPGYGTLFVPTALTLLLLLLSLAPRVRDHTVLSQSFWGAALALTTWQAVFFFRGWNASAARTLRPELRPQHYVQAMVQVAIFGYWGWYWRPVYDMAWLLAAQLVFAYTFDILLAWSRRDHYVVGFGPLPIIFSTNLFLWFKDDWFYLQFLMIAIGFLGKEFIRWQREGRSTHIFNPSAFSLGVFSVVLILTGTTHLTWGQDIATTLSLAPYIYLFIFLTGLVVMYFFSITLVAGSAAIVLFGLSAAYSAVTEVPYFLDSEIPTAVFLGLHLLVTDPSTSPRTQIGKLVFGTLYGLGVFSLYTVLGSVGVPTFYDKLLCVPLLNLSVRAIDRTVRHIYPADPAGMVGGWNWTPTRTNLVYMGLWIVFFGFMTGIGSTDGMQPGDRLPFWQQACADDRRHACERLLQIESSYCGDNSGWACNELGRHYMAGELTLVNTDLARGYFSRACELRFRAGCVNLLWSDHPKAANPLLLDLRLLLREGGSNLMEMAEPDLYTRACAHGRTFACGVQEGIK